MSTQGGWTCGGCTQVFQSLGDFEHHRVGGFETRVGGKTGKGTRRCVTPREMLAAGWAKNPNGRWARVPNTKAATPSKRVQGTRATPPKPAA